jgi:hypothetical protein
MSAPQRPELKYAVNFIHRQTGERREAIVSFVDLSPEARKFLDHNRITRPDAAPCIERALAYDSWVGVNANPQLQSSWQAPLDSPSMAAMPPREG